MKITKSLIIVSIIIMVVLPITVKAEAGDFYYGDSTNLQRIKKANIKDNKNLLKSNIDNLYFQVNSDVIVKYKNFMSEIISSWATGSSIGDSYKNSISNTSVYASDEIKSKAAELDKGDSDTNEFDVADIF